MAVVVEVPQKIVLNRATSIRLKDRLPKTEKETTQIHPYKKKDGRPTKHPLQMKYPDPKVFKKLESAEEKPKNLYSFK